ncbi:MAG: hypothetical protein IMF11_12490 [Proteobacteria bacterium]|nr:hypothetical protein [Pseudomonadota bacterium]
MVDKKVKRTTGHPKEQYQVDKKEEAKEPEKKADEGKIPEEKTDEE